MVNITPAGYRGGMKVTFIYTRMAIITCRESIHSTHEVERRTKSCVVTDVKIRINVTRILPTSSEEAAAKPETFQFT
jgi:predicted secreted Zn-dependent protease